MTGLDLQVDLARGYAITGQVEVRAHKRRPPESSGDAALVSQNLVDSGPNAVGVRPDERLAYSRRFVEACRDKGLQAVAITDHHCMTFLPFIRRAAEEELLRTARSLRRRVGWSCSRAWS